MTRSNLRAAITLSLVLVVGTTLVADTIRAPQPDAVAESASGEDGRAVEGGATVRSAELKPRAAQERRKPTTISHPHELRMTAAHDKVFDARKLHGRVIRDERPEHELVPGEQEGEDEERGPEDSHPDRDVEVIDPDLPAATDPQPVDQPQSMAAVAPPPLKTF